MNFNSVNFMFFFVIVLLLYYLFPVKYRYIVMLAAGYYFYLSWDIRNLFFLLPITVFSWLLGMYMQKIWLSDRSDAAKHKWEKLLLIFGICGILGMLCVVKYLDFLVMNLNRVCSRAGYEIHFPDMNIILPVGISFFSFQIMGYLIDVYRQNVTAERNVVRYALFCCFFPIINSGPIERAASLLSQIHKDKKLCIENIRRGLLHIAWGLFLKLVIADPLVPVINFVMEDYSNWKGCEIVVAVCLFGIRIYCDFYGYSSMAWGVAESFGYRVTDNFRSPYLSQNPGEFWRRWHISLTSWFRDYLYIPLGGNRKGELRTYMNILIVFTLSGLWHGAGINYMVWGLLNGIGLVCYNFYKKHLPRQHISQNPVGSKIVNCGLTFLFINITWFFFMTTDMEKAVDIIIHVVHNFHFEAMLSGAFTSMFGGKQEVFWFLISLSVLLIVDICRFKKIDCYKLISEQSLLVRWGVYLFLVFSVLILGTYGDAYEQSRFIYFDF